MEYEEFKDKFDKLLSMSKYNWVILNNTNSTIKANNYKNVVIIELRILLDYIIDII